MKTLRMSLLVCLFTLISPSIFCDVIAPAQGVKFSIATIDLTKIIDPQDPSKSQSVEWKESMETFQKGLEKEQKPLQDLQTKIQTKQTELDAKNKKGEQISKEEQSGIMTMFQELQSKTQQLQAKAEAQFAQIQKDFKNKIDAAVQVVADKKGFDAVFYKDVLVYAKNAVDITSDVITELNNKYAAEKRAKKMTTETPKKSVI